MKKGKKINICKVMSAVGVILVWICCIASIIFTTMGCKELRFFFFGMQIGLMIMEILACSIDIHNSNVELKELEEKMKKTFIKDIVEVVCDENRR